MLEYFIIFIITGFIITKVQENDNKVVTISALWMFIFRFWTIAAFFELYLGYVLARNISKK